jgi:hypothetical protein
MVTIASALRSPSWMRTRVWGYLRDTRRPYLLAMRGINLLTLLVGVAGLEPATR